MSGQHIGELCVRQRIDRRRRVDRRKARFGRAGRHPGARLDEALQSLQVNRQLVVLGRKARNAFAHPVDLLRREGHRVALERGLVDGSGSAGRLQVGEKLGRRIDWALRRPHPGAAVLDQMRIDREAFGLAVRDRAKRVSRDAELLTDDVVDRIDRPTFGEPGERRANGRMVARVIRHPDAAHGRHVLLVRRERGQTADALGREVEIAVARRRVEVLDREPVRDEHDEEPRRPSAGRSAGELCHFHGERRTDAETQRRKERSPSKLREAAAHVVMIPPPPDGRGDGRGRNAATTQGRRGLRGLYDSGGTTGTRREQRMGNSFLCNARTPKSRDHARASAPFHPLCERRTGVLPAILPTFPHLQAVIPEIACWIGGIVQRVLAGLTERG